MSRFSIYLLDPIKITTQSYNSTAPGSSSNTIKDVKPHQSLIFKWETDNIEQIKQSGSDIKQPIVWNVDMPALLTLNDKIQA